MVGPFFHGGAIFHANSMKFFPPPYYMNIHGGDIFSCNRTNILSCGKNKSASQCSKQKKERRFKIANEKNKRRV